MKILLSGPLRYSINVTLDGCCEPSIEALPQTVWWVEQQRLAELKKKYRE